MRDRRGRADGVLWILMGLVVTTGCDPGPPPERGGDRQFEASKASGAVERPAPAGGLATLPRAGRPEVAPPADEAAGEGEPPYRRALPLICPGEAVCRPGELRCSSLGGEARSTAIERCRADCTGFDVVSQCRNPVSPGAGPGAQMWPEVCGADPVTGKLGCLPCACVPGETRCSGGADPGGLERCVGKCSGWKATTACGDRQCCEQQGRVAVCRGQECLAGSAWCEGSVLALCSDSGCGPVDRQDCGLDRCDDAVGRCVDCDPAPEVCNGLDDDCDGTTDEGSRDEGTDCESGRPGRCADGRLDCIDGDMVCIPKVPVVDDSCNGVDEDCDWEADEHWQAAGRTCGVGQCRGPPRCEDGEERCEPGQPMAEVCNGLDDDCDGEPDEDLLVVAPLRVEVAIPKLLLVLDMSGSMIDPWDKYLEARSAIVQVLARLQGEFRFGFDGFPDQPFVGSCAVEDPAVFDCGIGNEQGIEGWLLTHVPADRNNTPLVRQIEALLGDPHYAPDCFSDGVPGESYVVVVSDGADSCGGEVAQCHDSCVRELSALTGLLLREGVRTIAVGYGAGAPGRAMNAIAQAGGTLFDEYLPAADQAGLVDALSSIADSISSCLLEVDSPEAIQQPELVNLFLDGDVVPNDADCLEEAGWAWTNEEHSEIELCERTCEDAQGGAAEVVLRVGCPTVEVQSP